MDQRVHLPLLPDDEGRTDALGVRDDVRSEAAPSTGFGIADPWSKRTAPADRAVSCVMADSVYVKANGEMPCWCDSGEDLILEHLSVEKLVDPRFELLNHPRIQHIRRSFHQDDRYPFDVCRRCAMVQPDAPRNRSTFRDRIDILHVESSWLCNLDCPLCVPKAARKTIKEPPFHVEPSLWVALVHNLKIQGVKYIRLLHFEGRGDPLMHPHLAHLCKVFHLVFPETTIRATTNGNFAFSDELFEGGLHELRVSADGAREASYQEYRRGGRFAKVLKFMRDAVSARERLGLASKVAIEWKYILFEWNDSDEEMLEAYAIADELGVELEFCLTPWAGKSLRFDTASLAAKIAELMPAAQSRPTRHVVLGLDRNPDGI